MASKRRLKSIFSGSTTYTCLLFLNKKNKRKFEFNSIDNLIDWKSSKKSQEGKIKLSDVTNEDWDFVVGKGAPLYRKLRRISTKLGDISRCLLKNVIISLLLSHKLQKCGIFAFNEGLAQLDGFSRVENSVVDFGKWLGFISVYKQSLYTL